MIFDQIKALITATLESELGTLPPNFKVTATEPKYGDVTTNLAMILAKQLAKPPHLIAKQAGELLAAHPQIKKAEAVGGFLNLTLVAGFWLTQLEAILGEGSHCGSCDYGKGEAVNVEYVSANPTGPLHIGHARGAVVGDVTANILEKVGFKVTREYYINDGGGQIEKLAESLRWRVFQVAGEPAEPPTDGYGGEYLVELATALYKKHQAPLLTKPLEFFATQAVEAMMALIKQELEAMGVRHQVFASERAFIAENAVEKAVAKLTEAGLVYEGFLAPPKGGSKGGDNNPPNQSAQEQPPKKQLLVRTTKFGDEVDRPLKRADGSWSYFAPDIAYHLAKYQRGFGKMVNVWGVDHFGYVKRLTAALETLTSTNGATKGSANGAAATKAELKVLLVALVSLKQKGKPLKMSKRSGDFITLSEVLEKVGADALRFTMLTRRNDIPLEFDLAKAVEQNINNPLFYVQYAHTRCCSVLRTKSPAKTGDLALLQSPQEQFLTRLLCQWNHRLVSAATSFEPHRIVLYLTEVATAFHSLWNVGNKNAHLRFITSDEAQTNARLKLVTATKNVVASGLGVLGIHPLEEM